MDLSVLTPATVLTIGGASVVVSIIVGAIIAATKLDGANKDRFGPLLALGVGVGTVVGFGVLQGNADYASLLLTGILAGGGFDLGLLLDGDADRAGAADERGTFVHQLQVTGLLMYYMAEHRGLRDPVVVSINNTSMAARLGERYGIETHETPVGFKYIGPKMIETGAMMGAEESGGFGFGMHLPERDGIYADLLLLDLVLRERAAGRWPVSRAIEHFHEIAGPSWYRRIDVHFERAAYDRAKRHLLVDLADHGPAELAGEPVVRTLPLDTNDGFKFWLADGSWLLVRASGTEPLVRVYTEATSEAIQDAMLAAGERLVRDE
jgi:phosphomannomutase